MMQLRAVATLALLHVAGAAYRALPEGKIIVAYATQCDAEQLIAEVRAGVNVLIWFALTLTDEGTITGGPEPSCFRSVRRQLNALGFTDVAHTMCIGGWDATHPSTVKTGLEWWRAFEEWNAAYGFDGIDWDTEGNDDLSSDQNEIPNATLTLISDMSVAAKAVGALVSLAPAQSYFDPTESGFDYRLNFSYADWHPEFFYRGRNAYAALVASKPPSFWDFVSVQFYESWSRCGQAVEFYELDPATYLASYVRAVAAGWTVDFGDAPGPLGLSGKHHVSLNVSSQLVLGFSTGTKTLGKMVYVLPSDVARAFDSLEDATPRGCMFWNAKLDGGVCYDTLDGSQSVCDLAAGFNAFLNVRPSLFERWREHRGIHLGLDDDKPWNLKAAVADDEMAGAASS